MRTTIDIDAAVLEAAKEVAGARRTSAGAVISEWARKGLQTSAGQTGFTRTGFPIFSVPVDAKPLTTATVNALLDDEGLPSRC